MWAVVPFAIPDSVRPLDPTMSIGAPLTLTNPVDGNPLTVTNDLTNFGGEYIWHCHLLGYEENDMMRTIVFRSEPSASIIGTAIGGNASATVSFIPPIGTGGSPTTSI